MAQTRRQVAFQRWPDSSKTQARTNLRHLLHILRRTLPEADEFRPWRGRASADS